MQFSFLTKEQGGGNNGRPPQLDTKTFNTLSSGEQCVYLAALGHIAPSTHNVQPWHFDIDAAQNTITLSLDRAYVLPESDPTGRQAILSIGCAIENICTGAQYFKKGTSLSYCDVSEENIVPMTNGEQETRYVPIVKITITKEPEGQVSKKVYESIFDRTCIRGEYAKSTAPKPFIKKLNELSENASKDGVGLVCITQPEDKHRIAELAAQADTYVLNLGAFQRELSDWLLPNDIHAERGIPGILMRLDDKNARRIHEGLRDNTLQPEDVLKTSLGIKNAIETSPLVTLVTCDNEDVPHWIAAGRLWEKALLLGEQYGLNASIHAGITEVPLITATCVSLFTPNARPVGLCRFGQPRTKQQEQVPRAPRAPLHNVITTHNS